MIHVSARWYRATNARIFAGGSVVCDRTFEGVDEAGFEADGAAWVDAFLRAKQCTDGIRRRAHVARLIIVDGG